MPRAVLTPFTRAAARRTGDKVWRKRILPVGSINYEGRTLQFTPGYLDGLAKAFTERAYDYVPFQLAGDDNRHTNKVSLDHYGGRVNGMDLDMAGPDGPGLYITLSANERGDKLLREIPDLGVSARIVEGYDRSDGKFFEGAIQHVLATHDPRVPGLGGWQSVGLSNDGITMTLDLSGTSFAGEMEGTGTMPMPELSEEHQARLATLLNVDATKWQQFVDGLNAPDLTAEDIAALTGDGNAPDTELTDAELEELMAAAQALDSAGVLEDEGDLVGAGEAQLSQEALMALELTNARADDTDRRLGEVTRHLDRERWKNERHHLIHDLSIPARIVDKARPLLEGAAHTVDLSGGQRVDAGAILREVLQDVGATNTALGLDMSIELGSPADEPEQHNQAAQSRADLVDRFRGQTGI
jgi:hypothetical protein